MNKNIKKLSSIIISAIIIVQQICTASANTINENSISHAEKDSRALAVMNTDTGIYLSWRLFESEDNLFGNSKKNVGFNIYKDGAFLDTVDSTTDYIDSVGTMSSTYSVAPVIDGIEGEHCAETSAYISGENYFDIPLNRPKPFSDGTHTYERKPADTACADLDGDGEYELVVKWAANPLDNSISGITGNVLLDAYKLDGTQLWRIDLGPNIREGSHYTQFIVYDFDNDGKAEMACKTAPGSIDGTGAYVSKVSLDSSIQSIDNSALYVDDNGFITSGAELYTMFDGETGKALDTIYYPFDRYPLNGWGKNNDTTNRLDRFLGTVAYLDGVTPSIISLRGYYGRMTVAAMNFVNNRIEVINTFDTNIYGQEYEGQGNHNITVADVDNDGKDEILTGAICFDHDLSVLWCSFRGHGDALHIGDYDPTHDGLEYFSVHEHGGELNHSGNLNDFGMTVYAAENGNELLHISADSDTGRGMMANVGAGGYYQIWGSNVDPYMSLGENRFEKIDIPENSYSFRVFWDGDLYDELLNGVNISSWNGTRMYRIFSAKECEKVNGTKSTPALQADILGDWREEVIYPLSSYDALRVFVSNIKTDYKIKTLMQDHVYRLGVATQNTGYNQPPHIGFYISDEMFSGTGDTSDKTVTFSITDEYNSIIPYACISINGTTIITDKNGTASIALKEREYSYTIEADGYEKIFGNIGTDSTSAEVVMTKRLIDTQDIIPHSSDIVMRTGTIEKLLYTTYPTNSTSAITISSTNTDILQILDNKYLYASDTGDVSIIITSDNGISKSIAIHVIGESDDAHPSNIEILCTDDTVCKSADCIVKSPYFEAVIYDDDGARINNADINWSADGAILVDTGSNITKIYVSPDFDGDTVTITASSNGISSSKQLKVVNAQSDKILFESSFDTEEYNGMSVIQTGITEANPNAVAQIWSNDLITFNGGFRNSGAGDYKTGISVTEKEGNHLLSCIAGNRNTSGRNAFITLDAAALANSSTDLVFEMDIILPVSKQDISVIISDGDNPITQLGRTQKNMEFDIPYHYVLAYNKEGYTEFITNSITGKTIANKLSTYGEGISRIDFTGPGGYQNQWAEALIDNIQLYETNSALTEITFKVRDKDGAPVQDAIVQSDGVETTTDFTGKASLSLLSGIHNVYVTFNDETIEKTVNTNSENNEYIINIDNAPFCKTILALNNIIYIEYDISAKKDVTLIRAVYDDNNTLKQIDTETLSLFDGNRIIPILCSNDERLFIWSSLNSMLPVLYK